MCFRVAIEVKNEPPYVSEAGGQWQTESSCPTAEAEAAQSCLKGTETALIQESRELTLTAGRSLLSRTRALDSS